VLWLDDCHQYLDGPLGEEVAAGLRCLLDGLVPGPVLVLSSMWQDAWEDFASQPVSGKPDAHPQARQLLSHAVRRVRIADFTGEQRETMARGSGVDARVVLAARTARSAREVIQVLTGGPALVEQLEHPDTNRARYTGAIVMAALDLRRVGCYSAIPHALLIQAAPAYLDLETCDEDPAGDWPETGLRWAATRVHGIRALNPYRNDSRAAVGGYQPHDYLDQHARRTRRAVPLPEEVWAAIADGLDDVEDMQRVAANAKRRAHYREAEVLWTRLVEAGQEDAITDLFNLVDGQGRADEITDLLWRQSQAGSWPAINCLADLLVQQGDPEKAIKLLRGQLSLAGPSALDEPPQVFHSELLGDYIIDKGTGPKHAAFRLADLLAEHGLHDEAIEMLRGQMEIQEMDPATTRLADLLSALGRIDEAIEVWRPHLEFIPLAILEITELLIENGNEQEATELLRIQSDAGNVYATERLGKLYIDQGHPGEAMALWREALEKGDRFVVDDLADVLVSLNRADQAMEMLRAQADAGHPSAGQRLAQLLVEQGRVDEAIEAWQRQIKTGGGWLNSPATNGDSYAVGELADLLVKLDRIEEALDLLRHHSGKGDFVALDRLAEFLVRMDCLDEAFALVQGEVNAGRHGATRLLAELLDFANSGSSINEDRRIRLPQDQDSNIRQHGK
jgi:tetratricopeptide (TPR) repeat protein